MFSRFAVRSARQLYTAPSASVVRPSARSAFASHIRMFSNVGDIMKLPAMSPTMEEGEITRWIKQEGEAFEVGDILFEIETDKATLEVEATDDGAVAKILVPAGSKVPVGTPIALTVEEGVDPSTATMPDLGGDAAPAAAAPTPPAAAPAANTPAPTLPGASKSGLEWSQRLTPSVMYITSLHNVTIDGIAGSGPKGIVTKGDVLKAIAAGTAKPAPEGTTHNSRPASDAPPASAPKADTPAPQRSAFASGGRRSSGPRYEDIPHTNMRRVIASRLTEAKHGIPHQYIRIDTPVDRLLAVRKEINSDPANEGSKVSVNDLIIKAVALSLRQVPDALAEPLTPIDVSVAVATETGLITPIVRAAEFKPVTNIAAEVKELAGRAKENKLKPEEFQGGTVTISNLGMFGTNSFTAIINPPQAIIFAIGNATQQLSEDGGVYSSMTIQASFDERAVDQVTMSKVMTALRTRLSRPESLV